MDPSSNTPNENPLLLVMACRRLCDMISRLVIVPYLVSHQKDPLLGSLSH